MDAKRFGEGYPALPDKTPPSNPVRREILVAPRKWMRFFDDTLTGYLADEPVADPEEFVVNAINYAEWGVTQLRSTSKKLTTLHSAESPGHVVSELGFHQLNVAVLPVWAQLLYDEKLTPEHLTDMQLLLAIENAPLIQRQRLIAASNSQESKMLIGRSTEVDAMVTFLEIMKTHPELTFVPAPLRFEANRLTKDGGGLTKNSDYVVVDTHVRQARGIQVKTGQIDPKYLQKYDSDYVTVVEGVSDFGNTLFRNKRVINQAGLLTLGLLADQPLSLQPAMSNRADFMRSRAIAREITRGVKPYLGTAVNHIGGRILRDLYKDTPKSETTQDTLVS